LLTYARLIAAIMQFIQAGTADDIKSKRNQRMRELNNRFPNKNEKDLVGAPNCEEHILRIANVIDTNIIEIKKTIANFRKGTTNESLLSWYTPGMNCPLLAIDSGGGQTTFQRTRHDQCMHRVSVCCSQRTIRVP
jgi:hypothetical protein